MENKAGKHGSAPMLYLTFCLLALILGGCSNKRCNGPKLQSLGANASKVDNKRRAKRSPWVMNSMTDSQLSLEQQISSIWDIYLS
jgi:hypothetical protein